MCIRDSDGTVKVAAVTGASGEAAVARIKDIVAEPELGVIYNGKVVKTVDFGAFVNFLGAKDGLVHISELQNGRTEKTTDICKEGDMVKVKVIGFDDRGKVKLSMKRVDQETGADLEAEDQRVAEAWANDPTQGGGAAWQAEADAAQCNPASAVAGTNEEAARVTAGERSRAAAHDMFARAQCAVRLPATFLSLSVFLSVRLPVCVCVCVFVCLSACLLACLLV